MSDTTNPTGAHELKKSLQPRHVEMIAIGGIIGAGLFVGSGASIAAVGPAVIISYALAGLLVLFVMRMLSEMAVANPGIQSFSEFTRLGLGNWAGFTSGWLYWYFWVIVVPIEAIAGAGILHKWLPAFPVWEIGAVLIAVLTVVNLLSTRSYGEFEFWFSSLKVGAIIVFIALAASHAMGISPTSSGSTFHNLTDRGGFMPHGSLAVLSGVTSVIFALCGAEISTIAAAESAAPSKIIGRMTSAVAVRILVFYVFSVGLIVCVVPWTVIVPGSSPFTTALSAMHIPGAALAMDIVVLIAVLSCLNSGLYVTSRVLFVLAAKGDAPQWLVKLDRRGVPARAILTGTVFGYAALLASVVSPQLIFTFLVNASGALVLVIYALVAISQVRLRMKMEPKALERLQVRMWFHPWGSIVSVAGIIAVLGAMALSPDHSSEFYASVAIIVLVVGIYGVRAIRLPKTAGRAPVDLQIQMRSGEK